MDRDEIEPVPKLRDYDKLAVWFLATALLCDAGLVCWIMIDRLGLRTTIDLRAFNSSWSDSPRLAVPLALAYLGATRAMRGGLLRRGGYFIFCLTLLPSVLFPGAGLIMSIPIGVCLLGNAAFRALSFQTSCILLPVAYALFTALFTLMPGELILTDSRRPIVSQARSEMRSMAVALESYYIDHNAYPAYTSERDRQADWDSPAKLPTFVRYVPGGPANIMTPLAYYTKFPQDTFRFLSEHRTFAYYVPPGGNGWIIISPGPDCVFDVTSESLPRLYDGKGINPKPALIDITFDPTNGTSSRGDVYRLKE